MRREVHLLGGRSLVISTNLPPLNGYAEPRSSAGDSLSDPGVAVYWYEARAKAQRVMACDRWLRVRDNIHAIALSIGALRGIGRWGATDIVDRAFVGFAALPPAGDDWWSVLGFAPASRPPLDAVKDRYRELALEAHPDRGGDPHAMVRLNQAMAAAERDLQ